jgi:hypothetical protein
MELPDVFQQISANLLPNWRHNHKKTMVSHAQGTGDHLDQRGMALQPLRKKMEQVTAIISASGCSCGGNSRRHFVLQYIFYDPRDGF